MAARGKSAAKVEATEPVGATVEVEWDGHTYTVPASLSDIDLDTLEAYVEDNGLSFAKSILGPEQWELLKERGRGKPHRFGEFRNAVGVAMGFYEGESPASSG